MIKLTGRIDATNVTEIEKELMDQLANGAESTLDASELEYISSAGLRALLKFKKAAGVPVKVLNVSPEVFDIFEVTGFSELLDAQKRLREISVEGCEMIGKGGNGEVFRLDEDKIVKVYKPWMSLEAIQREREFARTAFVSGVPSVIAYDVVKVGECYGVVFEMLKSDTLGHAMRNNPDKLEEYVDDYVALAKKLHSTHVPAGSFQSIQDVWHGRVKNLGEWCSEEEMALLDSMIDELPQVDTLTHNDLHPGNIMIQDGELVLIDMPEVTMGPPICDLVSIYRDLISAPQNPTVSTIEDNIGLPAKTIMQVGDMFFKKYTGLDDLEEYFQKIGLLYAFNVVLVCGSGSEKAMELAPMLMDRLLRGVVIPNEQAVRALLKGMSQ